MRVDLRVAFALGLIFILLLSTSLPAAAESDSLIENNTVVFTAINFVSNIETIGVAVSGTGLSPTAELFYRQSGQSLWHAGHYLIRIDDGRLIGSLFNLSPATSYDVKVSDGLSEINGSASTQPDELSFTPSTILNVDNSASPGGDGSAAAPFRTIQEAVNHASPGTEVLVADGMYREAVTFPNSGTSGNWIQVKAAGNAAILDSADSLSGNIWTLSSTSHVWFKQINGPIAYVARDAKRYYQYESRTGLNQALGHGNVSINEGWFYEPSTLRLYVRSLDNPANHTWQVPRLNHAFDVTSHDWIWIEGFEMRFYGTTTNGCGVCTLNASHLVIRNNKIHNMQLGIFVNWNGSSDQGNDTRIEGNEVSDPKAAEWPWASVKGSTMEGTGILVRGHIGAIVCDNTVHDFFNGIFTGSSATGVSENPDFAFDVDVYHNYIHHIMDDALEPEGACTNNRFRGNTIDRTFVGFSIAPITVGPTWFLRNTFANYTGRGIKFASNSDGMVLIYQNTGWTSATNVNGADLITSIHNVVMRNNIFQTSAYSFAEVPTGSTADDWNYDNWYTTRGSTGPHFKWENVNYNTMAALCVASGLECNGYEGAPGFVYPTGGDFTLLSSSPNIDRGVIIHGINDDFIGNGPDAGAYEFAFNVPLTVLSSVRANSNPTHAANVGFTVTFSKSVTGVNNSDFALTTTGVVGAAITNVSGSGTTYLVTVNTGSSNGTIRLDIVDDDSILDAINNPLGGTGMGNGNFTNGELYTIIKSVDIVGNVGSATATLNYTDVTLKTVTSDGSGNYSITIPSGWSGTVTPYKSGYTFTPTDRSYSNLQSDQVNQNYTAQVCANCADVNVSIGGNPMGNYTIASRQTVMPRYGMNGGPVQVKSTNGIPIFTSQRAIFGNSFNELTGFPADQLTTDYWFTFYDDVYMSTWLMIGNPDPVNSAHVEVYLGNSSTPIYTRDLAHGESVLPKFGVTGGPLRVKSTNGVKIFTSQRASYLGSFNELMGFPADQLTTDYWFTFYDDVYMSTWLMIGNPDPVNSAHVEVYLGNSSTPIYKRDLAHGESVLPKFGVTGGPLRVVSTNGVNIFTSERSAYGNSFNELMGFPSNQLTTDYWFTFYDDVNMATWLMIGNSDPVNSAHVEVYLGNGSTPIAAYDLAHGESVLPKLGIVGGPLHVVSTNSVPIFTSERAAFGNSFNELMGLPADQLTTDYWFTYYDDIYMSSRVMIGVP